jgi:uncharacterized protein
MGYLQIKGNSMHTQTIYQFKKMLLNLDQCMVKAAAFADSKKVDTTVLAQYRLAPDMFSFCAAYLAEQTPPKHEDNETTWKELRERIQKVVTYLDGFKDGDFAKSASVKVKPGWAKGQWMMADQYLNEIAIPNFYFHLMAAYAILRHAGVDIGKMDYLGKVDMQG